MLVSFRKSLLLEGEYTETKRKHFWSKPYEVREKTYLVSGISGICDEANLDEEVERHTQEAGAGWKRVVPYEELFERAKAEGWQKATLPSFKLIVEPVRDWTVGKAIEKLTGKQFAQYCRECGITQKDVIKIRTV
jgi:hypothetical protein